MVTFRQAFDSYYKNRKKTLCNHKQRQQWSSTIERYVYPKIGNVLVSDVTPADVIEILEPIWFKKAETARRILQRMELVFQSAIVRGQRSSSPCTGVKKELGTRHVSVEHLRALPYIDVPAFLRSLRSCSSEAVTKLAFEWLLLTGTAEPRPIDWTLSY